MSANCDENCVPERKNCLTCPKDAPTESEDSKASDFSVQGISSIDSSLVARRKLKIKFYALEFSLVQKQNRCLGLAALSYVWHDRVS